MRDEPKVGETAKTDYGNIISDAPQGDIIKADEPDVARLLEPGERVVWEGKGIIRTTNSVLYIAVGLVVLLTVVGIASALQNSFIPSVAALIVLVPGVLVVAILKAISERMNNNFIGYWLTNRHAIIIRELAFGNEHTTMIDLAATDAVKMIERGDGCGSIMFGLRNNISGAGSSIANNVDYSFINIPDVAHVYQMVQEAQVAARNQQG